MYFLFFWVTGNCVLITDMVMGLLAGGFRYLIYLHHELGKMWVLVGSKSSCSMWDSLERTLNQPSWLLAGWEVMSGLPGRLGPLAGWACPSPPPAWGQATAAKYPSEDHRARSRSAPGSLQSWSWDTQLRLQPSTEQLILKKLHLLRFVSTAGIYG